MSARTRVMCAPLVWTSIPQLSEQIMQAVGFQVLRISGVSGLGIGIGKGIGGLTTGAQDRIRERRIRHRAGEREPAHRARRGAILQKMCKPYGKSRLHLARKFAMGWRVDRPCDRLPPGCNPSPVAAAGAHLVEGSQKAPGRGIW